jgi:diguanylate cyclase (GGDEF)-like protein
METLQPNLPLSLADRSSNLSKQGDSLGGRDHLNAIRFRYTQEHCDALIMMVDDEPTIMEVMQIYLEDAGYGRFVLIEDSTEALGLMAKNTPDVLLLDLIMPGITGFEILESLRTDPCLKHVPVLVLTAANDAETKLKALELGATDFLAKPVDPSELALRVRNTLAAKAYLDHLSCYDVLTGLPNRTMFMEQLATLLAASLAERKKSAVLHIGLDRFRQINDTLGHSTGDMLLKLVAQRFEHRVRSNDFIAKPGPSEIYAGLARINGDEFTMLLSESDNPDEVIGKARRLLEALAEPFVVGGNELFATASIGIAISPDDGEDIDTLLKHADVALAHAKQRGGNTYQFYSDEINARSLGQLALENQLHKALDRNELVLYYQPKVEVASGRLVGAEALLRWEHSDLGLVSPVDFIPIAEERGLIVPIGEWVLDTACRQCKAWQSEGLGPLRMSVNVSARQFHQPGIIHSIESALDSAGLSGNSLVLELTESMLIDDPKNVIKILHRMKEIGVAISIDDFGTGYSSLSYLKQFPVDELKVDRSFVSDISVNADDCAIVTAIIAMGHSLGFSVVAEGVENAAELDFLRARDCEEYQGFFFSKPLPADEFAALARRSNAEHQSLSLASG